MPRDDLIQLRGGTPEEAAAVNPVLAAREPAWDGEVLKIGDGVTPWSDLPAVSVTPETVTAVLDTLLAPVAISGNYSDLDGTPDIPSAPGDIGAASASALTSEAQARADGDALALPKDGGTMTGTLVLAADPTAALHAATQQWVLARIADLYALAPEDLNTFVEVAQAIGEGNTALEALTLAVAGKQPSDAALTALSGLTTTPYGRALLGLLDAAAARTTLALGTAATHAHEDYAAASTATLLAAMRNLSDSTFTGSLSGAYVRLADAPSGGNDTAALQAALDARAAAGGGVVLLQRRATYLVQSAGTASVRSVTGSTLTRSYCLKIPSGVTLDLNGSTLRLATGDTFLAINSTSNSALGTVADADLGIVNGTIDGNNVQLSTVGYLMQFTGTKRLTLKDLRFTKVQAVAHVYAFNDEDTNLDNLTSEASYGNAFMLGNVTAGADSRRTRIGTIRVKDLAPDPVTGATFGPGNPLYGVFTEATIGTVIAVNTAAGVKFEGGRDNTCDAIILEGGALGTANSGLKFQGLSGNPTTRFVVAKVVAKGVYGNGVYFQDNSIDCEVTSYVGTDNGKGDTATSQADIWLSGTRNRIGTARVNTPGTLGLVVRAACVDGSIGELHLYNVGDTAYTGSKNGVSAQGSCRIGHLKAVDDRGGSRVMVRGFSVDSSSAIFDVGTADIRGGDPNLPFNSASDLGAIGPVRITQAHAMSGIVTLSAAATSTTVTNGNSLDAGIGGGVYLRSVIALEPLNASARALAAGARVVPSTGSFVIATSAAVGGEVFRWRFVGASRETHAITAGTNYDPTARANHTGTQTSSTISDFTEAVQDAVAGVLVGSGVTVTYDDAANTVTLAAANTTDLEAVRDAIGVALVGIGNISVTVDDAADTITISTTATVNDTDANLKSRANHTGTQAASTITGLAAVATSGAYVDLSGKPTAADVGAVPTSRTLAGLDLSADRSAAAVKTALAIAKADVTDLGTIGAAAALSVSEVGALGMAGGELKWVTGRYYGPSTSGTATVTALRLYAYPLWVPHSIAIDRIGVNVASAVAASTARLYLYSPDSNGQPGAILLDPVALGEPNLDTTTTGTKEHTVSTTLNRGLVWMCIVSTHAVGFSAVSGFSGGAEQLGHALLTTNTTGLVTNANITYGAGPTPFPARSNGTAVPMIRVRAA